ncbi:MAG: hypothetical protein AAFP90_14620 [Planctomycetota bacterium]
MDRTQTSITARNLGELLSEVRGSLGSDIDFKISADVGTNRDDLRRWVALLHQPTRKHHDGVFWVEGTLADVTVRVYHSNDALADSQHSESIAQRKETLAELVAST